MRALDKRQKVFEESRTRRGRLEAGERRGALGSWVGGWVGVVVARLVWVLARAPEPAQQPQTGLRTKNQLETWPQDEQQCLSPGSPLLSQKLSTCVSCKTELC